MEIHNLFQPFDIRFVKVNECPVKAHKNTFIELIYIMEGEGTYHINQSEFKYSPENLFLVMPMDTHYTEVLTTTSFMFIRFNNIYLNAQRANERYSNLGDWAHKLEYIFQNSNHLQGCILRNVHDKPLVRALMDAIVQEHVNQQTLHKELVQQLMNTLITVVARNISLHIPEKSNLSQSLSLEIIHYIHQNIYNPDKLKAENIASHFNISLNYISEYFKKHTNENLQQYIINYKLLLVEIRLKHSDMRLNEIAAELNFTDDSHLTKTFKKYKGVSPSEFRRGVLALAS
ncbi:helix-turn-helix domain-containing protein [Dyadobacter fanqingshengii]|uniref:AraC family transcriptional regulator n=1 Tax=Dyadobacter fanqingshengii TaxID=2906443 RepID=A0A9X1PB09_9BACT|nr:AraC family transcriptional regulator [Dyadobacter fanqingshengii]MCF0040155.1 AraC family transcriptional regulator [Dyadobacter fanqingshengii]USJ38093.1 AraC family transcriptional regulator [Dyadobacter fanqingshengii]